MALALAYRRHSRTGWSRTASGSRELAESRVPSSPGAEGRVAAMRSYLEQHGKPVALYSDKACSRDRRLPVWVAGRPKIEASRIPRIRPFSSNDLERTFFAEPYAFCA